MSRPRLVALLLALVTLLVYLPVWRHDFVNYDDNDYVTQNRVVQQGRPPGTQRIRFRGGRIGDADRLDTRLDVRVRSAGKCDAA